MYMICIEYSQYCHITMHTRRHVYPGEDIGSRSQWSQLECVVFRLACFCTDSVPREHQHAMKHRQTIPGRTQRNYRGQKHTQTRLRGKLGKTIFTRNHPSIPVPVPFLIVPPFRVASL